MHGHADIGGVRGVENYRERVLLLDLHLSEHGVSLLHQQSPLIRVRRYVAVGLFHAHTNQPQLSRRRSAHFGVGQIEAEMSKYRDRSRLETDNLVSVLASVLSRSQSRSRS